MPALLIGSHFKRPKAPIELPNGDGTFSKYFFTPVDPKNPDSEHVALIDNAKHQARLLSIEEGYYISEAQANIEAASAAAATVAKPTANAAVTDTVTATDAVVATVTSNTTAAAQTTPTEPEATAALAPNEITDQAKQLLALNLNAFKAALPRTNKAVIEAALAIESAKSPEEERPTFSKALQTVLKG